MSDINLLESIRTTMAEVASLIEKRMKNDLRAFAEAEVHRNISCIFVFLYFCICVFCSCAESMRTPRGSASKG